MALPTAKLASLVLKSISKPIAARLKQQAGVHPKFRNLIVSLAQILVLAMKKARKHVVSQLIEGVCVHPRISSQMTNIGQANHRITTTLQRQLYGHITTAEIRPLNEEKAVQAAVDLIGELFVFSVAGGLVIFEVQRSARSEARKEEKRRQEIEEIKQKEVDLLKELEILRQRISEFERLSRSSGLAGILKFRQGQTTEATNPI